MTTSLRPRSDTQQARLDRLRQALADAERGGATVMRIEQLRALLGVA